MWSMELNAKFIENLQKAGSLKIPESPLMIPSFGKIEKDEQEDADKVAKHSLLNFILNCAYAGYNLFVCRLLFSKMTVPSANHSMESCQR